MFLQAAQDGDGLRDIRGFHHNLLEAAVQGTVLLHDFGEFVHGGGADALQLAPGKGGLEHVGGIQASLGSARSHDGVELIDKQDDVRIGGCQFDDALEAFFKIAPVFGAGHHRGDVQRDDAFLREGGGNVAAGDAEGDSFHDGRFSHAGFADEHRIVLLSAAENLNHAGDFRIAAHHGIQFPLCGRFGEVEAEFLDIDRFGIRRFSFRVVRLLRSGAVRAGRFRIGLRAGKHPFIAHEGQQAAVIHAVLAQEGLAVIFRGAAQGQQQVLRRGFRAAHLGCFHHRDAQDILRITGEGDLVNFSVGDAVVGEQMALHEHLERPHIHAQSLHRLAGVVLAVADDAEEEMVRPDSVAAGAHRLFPGVADNAVQFV